MTSAKSRPRGGGLAIVRLLGWGWCGVAAGPHGVVAAQIGRPSQRACRSALEKRVPPGTGIDAGESRKGLASLRRRLGGAAEAAVALDLHGTDFQRRVWLAALAVPRGETRTYAEMAEGAGYAGRPYARAAGAALRANPALVLVPCHRVIPADGSLGGYAAGVAIKRRLLELEGPASAKR